MSGVKSKYVKFGVAIGIIVLGLAYLAFTGVQQSKSYYVTIKELRGDGFERLCQAAARGRQCGAGLDQAPGLACGVHAGGAGADAAGGL